jgi:hypothetical protein
MSGCVARTWKSMNLVSVFVDVHTIVCRVVRVNNTNNTQPWNA